MKTAAGGIRDGRRHRSGMGSFEIREILNEIPSVYLQHSGNL